MHPQGRTFGDGWLPNAEWLSRLIVALLGSI